MQGLHCGCTNEPPQDTAVAVAALTGISESTRVKHHGLLVVSVQLTAAAVAAVVVVVGLD